MKRLKRKFSLMLLLVLLVAGHLVSIRVLAEGEDPVKKTGDDTVPDGVLVGYQPSSERVVTGSHVEHMGFIGGTFSYIVNTYDYVSCCKKTDRAMDGCSGLPKCSDL